MLVVHVNDFHMAGPAASLSRACSMIRSAVKMEPPELFRLFLGCNRDTVTQEIPKKGSIHHGVQCRSVSQNKSC